MRVSDERLEQIKERRRSAYYRQQSSHNEPKYAFAGFYYRDVGALLEELAEYREREAQVSSFDLDCWHCYREADGEGRLKEGSFPIMWVCPTCGNKRCPKASHHGNDCTGSNEPGQTGSLYGGE